eukprot:jgi/Chlat1/243/Chrsp1S03149
MSLALAPSAGSTALRPPSSVCHRWPRRPKHQAAAAAAAAGAPRRAATGGRASTSSAPSTSSSTPSSTSASSSAALLAGAGVEEQRQLVASVGVSPSTAPSSEQVAAAAAAEAWSAERALLQALAVLTCLLVAALTAVLAAAVPAIRSMRKAADAFTELCNEARGELGGAAAAVRLTGLELAEVGEELAAVGAALNNGITRSSQAALAVTDTTFWHLRWRRGLCWTSIGTDLPL